jgi:hypothetical protein
MNATMTCVSADWDILQVHCKRNPSCQLWDEEMLLRQQERQQEREPEPDRERVAPPLNQQPAIQRLIQYAFDDAVFQNFFDEPVNDAPHRQRRNQANFEWMREPGWCSLTVPGCNLTQSKQRRLILCTGSLKKPFLP